MQQKQADAVKKPLKKPKNTRGGWHPFQFGKALRGSGIIPQSVVSSKPV